MKQKKVHLSLKVIKRHNRQVNKVNFNQTKLAFAMYRIVYLNKMNIISSHIKTLRTMHKVLGLFLPAFLPSYSITIISDKYKSLGMENKLQQQRTRKSVMVLSSSSSSSSYSHSRLLEGLNRTENYRKECDNKNCHRFVR